MNLENIFCCLDSYDSTCTCSEFKGVIRREKTSSSSSSSSSSSDDDASTVCVAKLSSKPPLRELKELPVTNWYNLGLQLQVRQEELERIRLKYQRDGKLCRTKMFGVWRRESTNPTYQRLLQALTVIGRKEVAETLCDKKGFKRHSIATSTTVDSNNIITPTRICPGDVRLRECDVPLLMSVLSKYAYKWREIGTALGFIGPELHTIASKPALFSSAPTSYLLEMLNDWVNWPNEEHSTFPTFRTLEVALNGWLVDLGSVAETLACKFGVDPNPLALALALSLPKQLCSESVCVQRYAEFLKSKYLSALPLMPEGEWPPNIGRQYCDLTVVERVGDSLPDTQTVSEKNRLSMQGKVNEMLKNEIRIKSLDDLLSGDKPLKVIVDGPPGVGKSTLVRKSCRDWAAGETLQQFKLVLLVTLKEQEIRHAKSIEELLEADDPELKGEVVKYLQKNSGEDVLFILDGFDELNEKEQTFFLKLLKGKQFHKCSIVLTSRSYAVESYKHEEWIHRNLEILGFTEKQIEDYFIRNITDQSMKNWLPNLLRERLPTTTVSYTPLNCSILLYIIQRERYQLPSTLSELFEAFVYCLLKRHMIKSNIQHKDYVQNPLDNLPFPLNCQFLALCRLSYDAVVRKKFLFSTQDIEEMMQRYVQKENVVLVHGLLVSSTSFNRLGSRSHYQFLHVTIQEYLAARWIKTLQSVEKTKFLQSNWISPRMRNVLVFYAGITGLKGTFHEQFFRKAFASGYLDRVLSVEHVNTESDSLCTPQPFSLCTPGSPIMLNTPQPIVVHTPVHEHSPPHQHQKIKIVTLKSCKITTSVSRSTQAFVNVVLMFAEANNYFINNVIPTYYNGIKLGYCRLTVMEYSAIARFISNSYVFFFSFEFCNLSRQVLDAFYKISTAQSCLHSCNHLSINYSGPTFPASLSLIPQIRWFQLMTEVCLKGLRYPNGLKPDEFQLCSLLTMKVLAKLTVTVVHIPVDHILDYENVFLKFVNALCTNKTLRELTYDQSPPAATCRSFVQLMSALSENKVLISLALEHTQVISPQSIIIPKHLCFPICSSGLIGVIKLAGARGIMSLYAHHSKTFSQCCIPNFFKKQSYVSTETPEMKHLISHCTSSDTMKSLELNLATPLLSDCKSSLQVPGISISSQTSIDHTNLRENNNMPFADSHLDVFSSVLAEHKSLAAIDLRGCNLTDEIAQAIAKGLIVNKTCQFLDINSDNLTYKGAAYILNALEVNKTFSNVCLFGCDVAKGSVYCSHHHSGYDFKLVCRPCISVSELDIVNIFKSLAEVTCIDCLVIKGVSLRSNLQFDVQLKEFLSCNQTLKCFQLLSFEFSCSKCVCIFEGIASNSSLEECTIELNIKTDWYVSSIQEFQCMLSKVLSINKAMRKLCLYNCELGDTFATGIANGLIHSHTLEVLDLSNNCISNEGAIAIIKALENNSSLVELDLSSNFQTWIVNSNACVECTAPCAKKLKSENEDLADVLERMLKINKTLKSLKLMKCQLDNSVALRIKTACEKCSCSIQLE